MGVTRRDSSGVFDADLKAKRPRKAAVLDKVFHLGPKGLTFVTEQFLPEWTEVGVEMRLPTEGAHRDHQVGCRGVVVQCLRRDQGRGFEVSLLFLDLPKKAQEQLRATPAGWGQSSISITR